MLTDLERRVLSLVDEDEVVRWTQELVRIPSVYRPEEGEAEEPAARWVEDRVPGARFTPQVQYCSVGGKLVRGDSQGSLRERQAYSFYEQIGGEGDAWGDGLVPVASALLAGSRQIVLEGVSHFTGFGRPWYGSPSIVPRWRHASMGDRQPQHGQGQDRNGT